MSGRAAIIWCLLVVAVGAARGQTPAPPGTPAPPPAGRDAFPEPPLGRVPPPRQPESELVLPNGQRVTLPQSVRQQIRFGPRYGQANDVNRVLLDRNGQVDPTGKGEGGQRWVYVGGVIVSVVYLTDRPGEPAQEVQFETDTVVAWVSSNRPDPSSGVDADGKTRVELYLSGNVVIRRFTPGEGPTGRSVDQILRAKEVYYDVSRNRAVARDADIELKVQGVTDPLHLQGREVFQYGPNEFEAVAADTFSSKRPADPALRISTDTSTLVRGGGPRTNVFGLPYRDLLTGRVVDDETRQTLTSRNVRVKVFDLPVFWLPRAENDVNEPVGPLTGFGVGNDQIFGAQYYTTWDIFKLLALRGPPGHRWVLYADYLSFRGPGFGTEYDYQGRDLLGLAGPRDSLTGATARPDWDQPFRGFAKGYVVDDKGVDNLGPDRGPAPFKHHNRGRLSWQQVGDLYENGTTYLRATGQAVYLSDANFHEQYYKQEFDMRPNQETFLNLAAGSGNAWAAVLLQKNFSRPWFTETNSLPRADAALIGQNLGPFSYTAKGNAGYYQLRPADPEFPYFSPPSFLPTEQQDVDTFRGNVNQRLGLPVDAGPFRVEPYGVADLAYYGNDLTGDGRGRFYGGGGARASTTLSRLFPDARSELFNVTGINHKVTWAANYFAGYSDTPYTRLPLLDRLNDDATDLGYRTARQGYARGRFGGFAAQPNGSRLPVFDPRRPFVSEAADAELARNPIFDPQRLAIRRLTPDRVDTLDSLQVLQLEARNRWQTKRGFPGQEHVVDWLALDLGMSVFPDKDRDNFGESTGQYMYNALWNVGDRTSLYSSGWYDPFDAGARYVMVGGNYNRPDNSIYGLSYRYTDPIDSRTVTAYLSYPLSAKYTVNGGASYDFGSTSNQITSLSFARTGTDVTLLIGFSYNAIVQNFGFQFAIVPNLAGISGGRLAGGGLNTLGGNPGTGR